MNFNCHLHNLRLENSSYQLKRAGHGTQIIPHITLHCVIKEKFNASYYIPSHSREATANINFMGRLPEDNRKRHHIKPLPKLTLGKAYFEEDC